MKSGTEYILSIDQSTSATKAMLFNKESRLIDRETVVHRQFYPHPGFVEHDPVEIFENTIAAISRLFIKTGTGEESIYGISITNQRETIVVWDKNSGLPVCNAAVWQCQRGAEFCEQLRREGYGPMIREKTGLLIDPYFSASKLHWIFFHDKSLKARADKGDLLLGTMDSWLLWKLTGGKVHATDYSNACRTMLFNIKSLEWDQELIGLFGLNRNMFPEVRFSDEVFGYTDPSVIFSKALPVSGLLGDSHAALVGQHCFSWGMAKATYGTGSSIMMNIGPRFMQAPEGLVTSIGYGMDGKINYVFEGNIHCTGDTINWLKSDVGLIGDVSEAEDLASSVDDNNGVYLVPAFVGLGAPYWDNEARACLSGMSRSTTKSHIVRAALESIAYQVKDLISLMEREGGIPLNELRVDGGPTRNDFLMQFQADMLGSPIVRPAIEEISALGAALMAGLAFGVWNNKEQIGQLRKAGETFFPEMQQEKVDCFYSGWKKAVERARL